MSSLQQPWPWSLGSPVCPALLHPNQKNRPRRAAAPLRSQVPHLNPALRLNPAPVPRRAVAPLRSRVPHRNPALRLNPVPVPRRAVAPHQNRVPHRNPVHRPAVVHHRVRRRSPVDVRTEVRPLVVRPPKQVPPEAAVVTTAPPRRPVRMIARMRVADVRAVEEAVEEAVEVEEAME